jgi:hypothetical protein
MKSAQGAARLIAAAALSLAAAAGWLAGAAPSATIVDILGARGYDW